jgi:hypothetical protein
MIRILEFKGFQNEFIHVTSSKNLELYFKSEVMASIFTKYFG